MTITVEYKKGQELTKDQIAEIEAAKKKPIAYDDDSPELTPAMEKASSLAARNRNRYNFESYIGIATLPAQNRCDVATGIPIP